MKTSSSKRAAMSVRSSKAIRDERGAMFVMGIPICFFMIGLMYFVFGLGEELVLRERIQDAADAGALSAAVVHARAMNLIALLNEVMAALVSLLIMVRMLEALLIVAMAIAAALAWFTGGASMSIVPGCEVAREEAENAWDALEDVVKPLVEAIHALEVGIQYGMPAIAEVRTIEVIAKFQPVTSFGFAIPGDYPLPLKDGQWPRLCHKAGDFAGKMILYPMEKLIPVKAVSNALGDAIGTLAGTFSELFCGDGGLTIPQDLPAVPLSPNVTKNIPASTDMEKCTNPPDRLETRFVQGPDGLPVNTAPVPPLPPGVVPDPNAPRASAQDAAIANKTEACVKAAKVQGMAKPTADGSPNSKCVYKWGNSNDELPCEIPGRSAGCLSDDGTVCREFTDKVKQAAAACKPGATANIVKYQYTQQDLTWRAQLVPTPNCGSQPEACTYTIEFATEKPQHVQQYLESASPPCGSSPPRSVGTGYGSNAVWNAKEEYAESEFLCSQPHTVVDPGALQEPPAKTLEQWQSAFKMDQPNSGWTATTEPYLGPPRPDSLAKDDPWPPPSQQPPNVPSEHPVLLGAWRAVPYVVSCEQSIANLAESEDYKKQAKAANEQMEQQSGALKQQASDATSSALGGALGGGSGGGGSQCGGGAQVHMELEPKDDDNVLGGSTYQMRAIAIRAERTSGAKKVVRGVPLRLLRGDQTESDNPLGIGHALDYVFAAQAEYYYDAKYQEGNGPDNTDELREEWVWHMSWKARMRRLRISTLTGGSSGSGSSGSGSSGKSSSSQSGAASGAASGCGTSAPSMDIEQAFSKGQSSPSNSGSSQSSNSGSAAPTSGGSSVSTLQSVEDLIIH